jgi:hypothetical protein
MFKQYDIIVRESFIHDSKQIINKYHLNTIEFNNLIESIGNNIADSSFVLYGTIKIKLKSDDLKVNIKQNFFKDTKGNMRDILLNIENTIIDIANRNNIGKNYSYDIITKWQFSYEKSYRIWVYGKVGVF